MNGHAAQIDLPICHKTSGWAVAREKFSRPSAIGHACETMTAIASPSRIVSKLFARDDRSPDAHGGTDATIAYDV